MKKQNRNRMKKMAAAMVAAILTLSLAGCGSGGQSQTSAAQTQAAGQTGTRTEASRVAVDGEVMGNNGYVAKIIGQETGGDLFAIETVQEYPGTHDPLLEFGCQCYSA